MDWLRAFLALVFFGVLLAGAAVGSYELYAYLGPKYEATRRDIMLNSRIYQEGELRSLYDMNRQFVRSKDDNEKKVIADTARHELATLDKERLPANLREFATIVEAY
jgi:hypothetical protein